jgi:hypothetical protein
MEKKRIHCVFLILPPAARGALFEKTAPLNPPQKLLIKGCFIHHLSSVSHLLSSCNLKTKKMEVSYENMPKQVNVFRVFASFFYSIYSFGCRF